MKRINSILHDRLNILPVISHLLYRGFILLGILSHVLMAAESAESIKGKMDGEIEGGLRRIELGFVLLPEEIDSQLLIQLSTEVYTNATNLLRNNPNPDWGSYIEMTVKIPHVLLVQYGCLAVEEPKLKLIIDKIAKEFSSLTQTMAAGLSVTDENIFLDFENIREKTHPDIISLYKRFRSAYMERIEARFPIAQALYEKYMNCEDSDEVAFIDKCYQNWGTPEENRIRPHFTLLYNYTAVRKKLEQSMNDIKVSPQLKTLNFSTIGIVEIDCRGNPKKLLHTAQFNSLKKVQPSE